MKTFLAAIAALTLLVVSAEAQSPLYAPVQFFMTNGVYAIQAQSATNLTAPGAMIDCRKQKAVGFTLTFQADSATTDNITFYFKRSIDGVKFSAAETIGLAMTGNTEKTVLTNIDTLGCGYLYLTSVSNAAATAIVTNVVAKYALKISSP